MIEQRMFHIFRSIISRRWLIIVIYGVVLPGAAVLAFQVPRDNSIERMVVASDPEVTECQRFQEIFPEGDTAYLMLETEDPFSAEALRDLATLQQELDVIAGVDTFSIDTVWQRSRPSSGPAARNHEQVEALITGTPFFRRQGMVGEHFLAVVVTLDAPDPPARSVALSAIDLAVDRAIESAQSIDAVRRIGKPWIDEWLERETSTSSIRFFPLFGVFVVTLVLGLFRSGRALATILLSLAAAVLLGMAFAAIAGLSFSIVSALVPLTLLVTATASLVYLHSRFVDQSQGIDIEVHRVQALANKFVAVTASVFAAAVGFAALTVSNIRPIRELGIWTSGGLVLGWIVCFTLYPALQKVLRTPTRLHRQVAGTWVIRAAEVIPLWSYRWRWPLVITASVLCVAGLVALLGIPGVVSGMQLETDALAYVDPDIAVARDTRYFEEHVLGLTSAKVWVATPEYGVLEPEFLRALDRLGAAVEADPAVGAVVGLMPILRLRDHLAGDAVSPGRPEVTVDSLTLDLEMLLLTEPSVSRWVDLESLSSTYLVVTTAAGAGAGMDELAGAIASAWQTVVAAEPGLEDCSYRLAGSGVLQATIANHLVPTLVESFAITFTIIFVTFIVVFRSGPARLNAMVPSMFAILVTFLIMRLTGIPLNIATILIATTVLGVTENDQIHFFYHFLERRKNGTTEQALAHSIRVAGHAILFATIINAGGFMALALSDLPPMRQFGIVTALAFGLAMLADFTALPAALWIFFREKPTGTGTIDSGRAR